MARLNKQQILDAANALAAGNLVALPTETVYGLGADATNEAAVRKIFAAKGRPADHPLIVHLAKGAVLEDWAKEVSPHARKLVAAFWPGPLTIILRKSSRIPKVVTGGQATVGLRCPSHPIAQSLLREFAAIGSGAVAAPSANKFGHVSPTTAEHVRDEFGEEIDRDIYLLDGGPCEVGIESTILDLSREFPVLLRPGAITREQIFQVIGVLPRSREDDERERQDAPRVSGSLAAHYAPRTPLELVPTDQLNGRIDGLLAEGRRVGVLAFSAKPKLKPSPVGVGVRNARPLVWIAASGEPDEFAHGLYANLRTLDAAGTALLLVESPPNNEAWAAVNDRLGRAAVGSQT